ncbi:MAG: hypothetical protein AAB793_01755 [Patescibacteria group bacterium]
MIFNGLIKNLIRAIIAAYWPLWIFGIIIISIDFFVFKSATQAFIITILSFTAAAVIFHEIGHIIGIKFFAKLPYHSIKITTLMFQTTLNHPPVEEKIWMMIVWSGSLMNIFIGLMGWLILPNGFYQGMWAALQIGFGIINLMPFSPDGEKLFAYYQAKEQKI